jgi:hypothetical protein
VRRVQRASEGEEAVVRRVEGHFLCSLRRFLSRFRFLVIIRSILPESIVLVPPSLRAESDLNTFRRDRLDKTVEERGRRRSSETGEKSV